MTEYDEYDLISDEREWSDEENIMLNDDYVGGELGYVGKTAYKSAHSKRSREIKAAMGNY